MADKIKKSDLFEDGLFDEAVKGGERLAKTIDELQKGVTSLMVTTKNKINVINPENFKDIQELNKQVQNSVVLIQNKQKLDKEAIKIAKDLETLKQKQLKTQKDVVNLISAEEKELKRANKEKQNTIKNEQKLNSVYEQNKKSLKSVSDRYKELISRGKEGTATGKLLKAEFDRLDKSVRKAEQSVGQFNRNVGNYKNAIKDAIKETGIFNGTLGRVVSGFQAVKNSAQAAGGGVKTFSTILKASGIGLIIAAIGVLTKAVTAFIDASQKAQDQLLRLDLSATQESITKYIAVLQEARPALRNISKELQNIANDDQDLKDIIADETVSITIRNEALRQSILLSQEKSKLDIKAAEINLKTINAEIEKAGSKIGQDEVLEELLIKRTEAENKLSEAKDNQNDLIEQSARRERQLHQERIINDVELTRSNKLTANKIQVTLQKQFDDERTQLEEREKIATKLQNINLKAINEEVAILRKAGLESLDFQKLVETGDEVELKNIIRKNHANIEGTAIEIELFKVVKQAQENDIRNQQVLKKLEEDRVNRANRINQINAEISILKQADDIKALEGAYDTLNDALDDNLTKSLENENVFSGKLKKQREIQRQINNENAQDIFDAKTKLLIDEANLEKKNVENSKEDEQVKAAEILKINTQLQIDLENLRADAQAKEIQDKQKVIDAEKAIAKKKLDIAIEYGNKALDIAEEVFEKQSAKREAAYDKEIEQRENNIERQRAIAEKGLVNTLAFEEQQKAKAELAKEQEKRREEKRQKAIAFLRLLAAYAEKDPDTAITKAVADMALASLIEGSFATGVEGLKGEGTETSDSILARLSKNESVITAKATKENAGLPTAMNEGRVDEYFTNKYLPKVAIESGLTQKDTASNIHSSLMLNQLMGVNNRLQRLEKAIVNKKEQNVEWDKHGNLVIGEVESGIKRTVKYMKRKPLI